MIDVDNNNDDGDDYYCNDISDDDGDNDYDEDDNIDRGPSYDNRKKVPGRTLCDKKTSRMKNRRILPKKLENVALKQGTDV